MPQSNALFAAVEHWYVLHIASLQSRDIKVALMRQALNPNKNSVGIDLSSPRMLLQAVVWDSGEAEVTWAARDETSPPAVEVLLVNDPSEVEAMLDRLATAL